MEQEVKANRIPVLEIFGPTIQGEGMVIGRKTIFVRTAGCDYRCSWCDSAFTWDGSEKPEMLTVTEIMDRIDEIGYTDGTSTVQSGDAIPDGPPEKNYDHVTISGGNPALLKNIGLLVSRLHQDNTLVSLETQGSKWQPWMTDIDDLTISPKPPSSGMTTNYDVLDMIISNLSVSIIEGRVSLKVVVFDDADFAYAARVHRRYPHVPMFVSVGNTDVHTSDEAHFKGLVKSLGWLFDKIIADPDMNNVRPLPQLHTLVWGNARSV